jgi:tetratricopeptide (TPR) repeat protein
MVGSFFRCLLKKQQHYICAILSLVNFIFYTTIGAMKYICSLLLLLFGANAYAQPDQHFNTQRALYYSVGMTQSIKHFDSMLQYNVGLRNQNKLTETVFLEIYEQIENRYKAQAELVASIAEKWTLMLHQRPSRTLKTALSAISNNRCSSAFSLLRSKRSQLNRQEQSFYRDLFLFVGDHQQADALLSQDLQDSLAAIAQNRFQTIEGADTSSFVDRKIYIAQLFENEKQLESAIATLLEAQKWNDDLALNDIPQQIRKAQIAQLLATLQLSKSDVDNAYKNAKIATEIYETLVDEKVQVAYAKALHTLSLVYKTAGANKEAETYFNKTIAQYKQLSTEYPQRFQPILAAVLEDFAQVQLYYDLHEAYEKNLTSIIDMRRNLTAAQEPFNLYHIGNLHNLLGHKKMNTDLKVFLAQDEWLKSSQVLDSLYKRAPLLAGQELCAVLYKLGGSNLSLKKRNEALPFFMKSLNVRKELFKLAPTTNKMAYIDILIQNGTLNAWEHKNNVATLQLDQAIQLADELGDTKRAQEIRKFKKDVLTH